MAGIALPDRFGSEGEFVILDPGADFQPAPDARLALRARAIQRLEQGQQRCRIQPGPRFGRGAAQSLRTPAYPTGPEISFCVVLL